METQGEITCWVALSNSFSKKSHAGVKNFSEIIHHLSVTTSERFITKRGRFGIQQNLTNIGISVKLDQELTWKISKGVKDLDDGQRCLDLVKFSCTSVNDDSRQNFDCNNFTRPWSHLLLSGSWMNFAGSTFNSQSVYFEFIINLDFCSQRSRFPNLDSYFV